MRTIIYGRVSTTEQEEKGYSLDEQVSLCTKRAYELGCIDDDLIIITDSESGEFLNRTGFTEVIKILDEDEDREIKYFICYDPDRLSRSLTTELVAMDIIERHGTKAIFLSATYEATPEGKLFFHMRSVIAEYEKEKIKIRTMMGKLGKAKKRLLTHSPGLYGYIFNTVTDELTINEEEAKIITLMVNWILEEGIGYKKVADRLNAMNILPPRGKKVDKKKFGVSYIKEEGYWFKHTVKRILTNYSYTGTLYVQKFDSQGIKFNKYREEKDKVKITIRPKEDWYGVKIPTIINLDKWEKLQEILTDKKNKKPGHSIETYLLSGLIRCGICGNPLRGNRVQYKTRNGKYYKYYTCAGKMPTKIGDEKCQLPGINSDDLEEQIWDLIKQWIIDSDSLKESIDNGDNIEPLLMEKKNVGEKIKEINGEKERLDLLFMKGKINENQYDKYEKDIEKSMEELQGRIKTIEKEIKFKNSNSKDFENLLKQVEVYKDDIENITIEGKKKLFNGFISKVIVYDKEKISVVGWIPEKYFGVK